MKVLLLSDVYKHGVAGEVVDVRDGFARSWLLPRKLAVKATSGALKQAGVDFAPVPPRYRSGYFSHIFAGGYSAGYYAYLWSEVLDADSVEWFREHGGLKRENGDHFRKTLLSRGGSEDAMKLFQVFRGRAPDIQPLLERRGLDLTAP